MKRAIWAILTISLLIPVPALAGEPDRIAIATEGKTSDAPVSSRTGRCPFYLIYDEQGKFVQAIDNPFLNIHSRPAGSMIDSLKFDDKGNVTGGITTPSKDERDKVWDAMFSFFAQWRIKVIVAEEFGDEIIRAFKARGISCIAFKGNAQEAIKKAMQSVEK
jgi:predicted Fe-Mo cluster-binding NifX family protein